MKTTAIALGLLFVLAFSGLTLAQQTSSFGNMTKEEFERINKEGAAKVKALSPTAAPLSSADQDLMLQVAKGGMMQLEVSRIASQKASSEQVRQLALAEVEEQTNLSAKLKEIAAAKKVTLPTAPDNETKALISKMQGMSGNELDRFYVQESGVNGHEKLDKVMSSVESNAKDANLKSLAAAAHPLVKTHLQVANAMLTKMPAGNKAAKSSSQP